MTLEGFGQMRHILLCFFQNFLVMESFVQGIHRRLICKKDKTGAPLVKEKVLRDLTMLFPISLSLL